MSLPVQSQRLQIMAYYGYGSPSLVSLTGRVLVDPGLRHSGEARSALKNLANMARRFESDEIPYAVVRAQLAGVSQEVVADAEGYFTVTLVPPEPLPLDRLWHAIELTLFQPQLPNTEPVQAIGQILVPLPGARFGIISDIDDTVIQSRITRRLRMVLTLLLRNPQQRMPMPGISALYQALYHAASSPAVNPIFYVSNSPWNLYDLLIRIFVQRDIPAGPLFL